MNPGIHLVHKAEGPTSFSLVQACLGATEAKDGRRRPRVCHGGTLDPFASGLLLILVEPATRLFDYLHAIPKVYEATVRWGIETDNGDPGGKVAFSGDASGLNVEQLDAALATFVGWQDQIPHATSAKRVDGERAYLKAHRGETVVMPASRVYLHEARWLGHDLPRESRMRMIVRGGYYVRALRARSWPDAGVRSASEQFASHARLVPGAIRGRIGLWKCTGTTFCRGRQCEICRIRKWAICGNGGKLAWANCCRRIGCCRWGSPSRTRRFGDFMGRNSVACCLLSREGSSCLARFGVGYRRFRFRIGLGA